MDVLFRSTAEVAGKDKASTSLAGMGDDGPRGMRPLHDCEARTIAKDEASYAVFEMPKKAIKLGDVDHAVPQDCVAEGTLNQRHAA